MKDFPIGRNVTVDFSERHKLMRFKPIEAKIEHSFPYFVGTLQSNKVKHNQLCQI